MAKFCPITNKPVVYLTCFDCDEKTCLNFSVDDGKPMSEPQKNSSYILCVEERRHT